MRLDKLTAINFLTYKELDYTFEKKALLVQGINKTEEHQKSNGSGKSGLQTAIEFCLTASNSRGVKDCDLVTFGKKQSELNLFLSCDHRKENLHINWIIKTKGSNLLKIKSKSFNDLIYKDVSFSNVNDGKKFILNWLAISKEDLFSYFIINKARFKSFFDSSNKEKVALINRFSDASILDNLDNLDYSHEVDLLEQEKSNLNKLQGALELVKENYEKEKTKDLSKEKDKIKKTKELEIQDLKDKIDDYKDDIDDCNEDISDIKKDLKNYEKKKVEINSDIKEISLKIESKKEDLKKLKEQHQESKDVLKSFVFTPYESQKNEIQKTIDDINKKISNIQHKVLNNDKETYNKEQELEKHKVMLKGAISCPSCSHSFVLDNDLSIDEIKQSISKIQITLKDLTKNKEKLQKEIDVLKNNSLPIEQEKLLEIKGFEDKEEKQHILLKSNVQRKLDEFMLCKDELLLIKDTKDKYKDSIQNINDEIYEAKEEAKETNASIKSLKLKIKGLKEQIKLLKQSISSIKLSENKELLNDYLKQIEQYEVKVNSQSIVVSEISDKIQDLKTWKNRFKEFKSYVANKSLEIMEYHCNRYLKEMNTDMRVVYDGFKVLSNGKIKDEISAKVSRGEDREFYSFSAGERGIVLFSSILANRYLINNSHPYGGLDFLSIDEVFEGVDSLGLNILLKSIQDQNITIMVITHVSDEHIGGDKLTIIKENGISKIVK